MIPVRLDGAKNDLAVSFFHVEFLTGSDLMGDKQTHNDFGLVASCGQSRQAGAGRRVARLDARRVRRDALRARPEVLDGRSPP